MLTQNVLRNNAFEISSSERDVLERAIERTEQYSAGYVAVKQGAEVGVSLLLVRGLMTRHIDAPDGRARPKEASHVLMQAMRRQKTVW